MTTTINLDYVPLAQVDDLFRRAAQRTQQAHPLFCRDRDDLACSGTHRSDVTEVDSGFGWLLVQAVMNPDGALSVTVGDDVDERRLTTVGARVLAHALLAAAALADAGSGMVRQVAA